jgi:hypothetical protein
MNYNYVVVVILNAIFIYLFSLQYLEYPELFSLKPVYPPKIINNIESKCPKVIYQIVPDIDNVPSGLYHTILHNIRMNPEFEYKIYDYDSAFELLKNDFPSNSVQAYLASNNNQIKTDYIKYAFIHKYGGIFLDIKYICMHPFIELLKYNNVYFVQLKRIDDMDLSILASHPNNPGIKNAFDTATSNLCLSKYTNTLNRITGGTVIRDELFNIGYLSDFTLLHIDTDHIIRMKHTQAIICKKYLSYDNENTTNHLLPNILIDFQEKILYNNDAFSN